MDALSCSVDPTLPPMPIATEILRLPIPAADGSTCRTGIAMRRLVDIFSLPTGALAATADTRCASVVSGRLLDDDKTKGVAIESHSSTVLAKVTLCAPESWAAW